MDMSLSKLREMMMDKEAWCAAVHGVAKCWTRLSGWTELIYLMGLPRDSVVENLPAMQKLQEMQIRSLGWEDPLETGMATHSSILAWRIPWRSIASHNWSDYIYSIYAHGSLFLLKTMNETLLILQLWAYFYFPRHLGSRHPFSNQEFHLSAASPTIICGLQRTVTTERSSYQCFPHWHLSLPYERECPRGTLSGAVGVLIKYDRLTAAFLSCRVWVHFFTWC